MDDVIAGSPVRDETDERPEVDFSRVFEDQQQTNLFDRTIEAEEDEEESGGGEGEGGGGGGEGGGGGGLTDLGFGDFSLQASSNALKSVWDDLLNDAQNEADLDGGQPLHGNGGGGGGGGGDSSAPWGLEFDNDFDATTAADWSNKANGSDVIFGDQNEAALDGSDWLGFDIRNSPDGKESELGKSGEDDDDNEVEKMRGNVGKGAKEDEDWFGKDFTMEDQSGGGGVGPEVGDAEGGGYDPFLVGKLPNKTNVLDLFSGGNLGGRAAELDSPEDFDPRAESPHRERTGPQSQSHTSPIQTGGGVSRSRPRPKTASKPTNPFNIALREAAASTWDQGGGAAEDEDQDPEDSSADPFNFDANLRIEPSDKNNPFAEGAKEEEEKKELEEALTSSDWNAFPEPSTTTTTDESSTQFNPFATIIDDGDGGGMIDGSGFDPFQTIHDDDAFVLPTSRSTRTSDLDDPTVSPSRFNPFDKEPPLPEQFASLTPVVKSEEPAQSPVAESSENSIDEPEMDALEPLDPFYPIRDPEKGWNLLLRQPFKKKLTQNRFWKPAHVRLMTINDCSVVRVFASDKDSECLHELALQPTFTLCEMGLQQLDQFGKCHTVKIQQVSYRASVGMKSERIAPTISDLTRVRDFKSLKDLVHKPKATMILDHAPHATEILKFGGLDYGEFKDFIHSVEDVLFSLKSIRGKSASYSKDEITVDVQDEYYGEIDKDGHITFQKARVRLFCLAFLSESPIVEVGINDRKRRGREVVGRRDIIPIKTEEWIRTEDPELHSTVDMGEFDKTKVIKFNPLDACHFELMRFRVRLKPNLELPLQIRVRMSIVDRHIEVRTEVMVTGYYSNSRRAAQTPCEDIQIRFPVPESWIYLFRVEKRFKYGAIHSSTRKPGKIKGLERLTMFAQGILPASLIEVSTGLAKYENAFQAVVWRIDQLPERNEGAYKTHLMVINLDLAAHDKMPEELDRWVHVEYSMSNSTVSRAQVRSIAISGVDEPPDRWVRHLASYEYKLEIEFTDQMKAESEDVLAPVVTSPPPQAEGEGVAPTATAEGDTDDSSSDSD